MTGLARHHAEEECDGPPCPIHSPSDHPLKDAPMNMRFDTGVLERSCEHGVGHPDPDHLERIRRLRGDIVADGQAVHGCCSWGCCSEKKKEEH